MKSKMRLCLLPTFACLQVLAAQCQYIYSENIITAKVKNISSDL